MMRNVNRDMHKCAEEQDMEMLEAIADYGAWMECTMADDPCGNTALHKAVLACTDYDEFKAEAKRLKLRKCPETMDYTLASGLRKFCTTKFQLAKLGDEIVEWKEKRARDVGCIGLLCLAKADPRLVNKEGKTALELAASKHPEVIDQLTRQIADMELREELEEAGEEVHKVAAEMNDKTGLYERGAYYMRDLMKKQKAEDKKAKQANAKEEAKLEEKDGVGVEMIEV
jgi:hypothetical protein